MIYVAVGTMSKKIIINDILEVTNYHNSVFKWFSQLIVCIKMLICAKWKLIKNSVLTCVWESPELAQWAITIFAS